MPKTVNERDNERNNNVRAAKGMFDDWLKDKKPQILNIQRREQQDAESHRDSVRATFRMTRGKDFYDKWNRLGNKLTSMLAKDEKKYSDLANKEKKEPIIGEAWRSPYIYFCYYCLTNGIAESDMLKLAEENPPKEIIEKVEAKLNGFYDLVIKEDTEKVRDFYVKIAEMSEKKLPDFAKLADEKNGLDNSIDDLLLYFGSHSIISQSLGVGDPHILKSRKQMIDMVNDQLKKEGKSYSLEQAMVPLQMIHIASQNLVRIYSDGDVFRDPQMGILPLLAITEAYYIKKMIYDPKCEGVPDKVLGNIKTEGKAGLEMYNNLIGEVLMNMDPDVYTKPVSYEHLFNPKELAEDLADNCHTVMGVSSPSKEYDVICKDLEEIDKKEKLITQAERKKDKVLAVSLAQETKKLYEKLQADVNYYTERKNPNSESRRYRYQLALEAGFLAEKNLERVNAYLRTETVKANIQKANTDNPLEIGSEANLKKYMGELSQSIKNNGFSLDRLAHLQAARIMLRQPENNYIHESRTSLELMAKGIAHQPEFQSLARKIPEGTKVKSVPDLFTKLQKEHDALNRQHNIIKNDKSKKPENQFVKK